MAKKTKDIDQIANELEQATNVAAKRFADKETGQVYEEGSSLDHLSEKRLKEIKERGFIKDNDKS